MDLMEQVRLWRENINICNENGFEIVEIPKSHIEVYKDNKLLKVVYSQKSLNFYLKSKVTHNTNKVCSKSFKT